LPHGEAFAKHIKVINEGILEPIDTMIPSCTGLFLKIDVEGFEYRVLQGALNHLSKADCKVLAELHSWGDPELKKLPIHVLWFMTRAGFGTKKLDGSHYTFRKERFLQRWFHFFRFAPPPFLKMVLRRIGGAAIVARWDSKGRTAHDR
jgi:hypothetical protein